MRKVFIFSSRRNFPFAFILWELLFFKKFFVFETYAFLIAEDVILNLLYFISLRFYFIACQEFYLFFKDQSIQIRMCECEGSWRYRFFVFSWNFWKMCCLVLLEVMYSLCFFFVSSLRRLLEWVFLMFIIIALEGCFYWRGCELGCVYRIHLKMFWVSFFLRRALVIDFCVPKRIVWFLNVWVVYVFLNVVVLIIFGRIIDDWFWRFEGDGLESYC